LFLFKSLLKNKIMSHIIKKFSILFLAGIIFLSIPHNFAQSVGASYDVSGFASIMNDAPCIKLQYDLKPNSRDYYIYGNVMKLQMFLYQNDLMAYPPTGLYGDYTFNAVMNFQKQMGIPATGVVDLYTRMALAKSSCGSSYNPNDFYVSQGYGYGYNSLPQNTIQQNVVIPTNPNITNQSQPGNSPFGYQTNTYYTPYVPVPVSQASTIYHCGLNNIDYGNQASYNAGCISSNATNFTVTFISNNSTLSTQTIASGATAATPTAPTLSGYTFGGWYSDSGFSSLYNFSTPVTYNISIYAKWTAVTPGAPVAPAAVSVSNVSTSSLTLIWLASASSTGYQITADHGFVSTTTSNLSINLSSLLSGTSYTFGVAAYNSNGTSSPITISTTTLSTSTPTIPTVYDLDVDILHNYIANGVVVHNSIYAFRGADFRNIVNFQKDYPQAKVFHLEQNYRSTQIILDAAHAIISENKSHPVLKLWTDKHTGAKITPFQARTEVDEAMYVIEKIRELSNKNYQLSDFAVLYRTNAQSRSLEEAFLKTGIHYQLIGGLQFYQRKEIKDVLSYLRLVTNPSDSIAKKRIEKIGKGFQYGGNANCAV
jgi:uncharacterized repeat protein (TIGR02543 family)